MSGKDLIKKNSTAFFKRMCGLRESSSKLLLSFWKFLIFCRRKKGIETKKKRWNELVLIWVKNGDWKHNLHIITSVGGTLFSLKKKGLKEVKTTGTRNSLKVLGTREEPPSRLWLPTSTQWGRREGKKENRLPLK